MVARHLERAIEALARRQHGVLARRQVLATGASPSFIDRRLRSGAWMSLAPGVYALPGNPSTWQRQAMAAVLFHPQAVLSGTAAAALHGVPGYRRGRLEVTVPPGGNHRSPLAVVRRRRAVDRTRVDGIPVVTVGQLVCDLAGCMGPDRLAALVDDVVALQLTSVPALARRVERVASPPFPGRASLVGLLAARVGPAAVAPTSVLEGALYRIVDDPRFPPCERQARPPWRLEAPQRVDLLIPAWRLIVEADGRSWHSRVADFARDRQRDRMALRHGYAVARYVHEELLSDPDGVRADLLAIGRDRAGAGHG